MPDARVPTVSIVSGVPRSGTSMMMRMLEAGGIPPLVDDERPADEDNPGGYYEYAPAKRIRRDASWMPQAVGKAVKMVYLLLRDLPVGFDYRIVLMRRDLREVVASQRVMLDRKGASGGPMDDEALVEVFRRELAELADWAAAHPRLELLPVDYNELMRDTGPVVERIATFLGGGLDTAAMAAVVDPTLYRQRGE